MYKRQGYIAAATSDYLQNVDSLSLLDGIKWTLYQSTMETVSAVSEASVIVTNTQGEILYATDSDLYHKQIPDRVVQQILQQGHYNGITNLGGVYGANRYIAGLPVQTKLTPTLAANLGLVLVSGDTSGLSEMWRATATIFFFAAVVVLLIAVIASSITSAHQTRPLTEMAEAARKFGRGEFDVRVNSLSLIHISTTAMEPVSSPAPSFPRHSRVFSRMPTPPASVPHRCRTSGAVGSAPPRQRRVNALINAKCLLAPLEPTGPGRSMSFINILSHAARCSVKTEGRAVPCPLWISSVCFREKSRGFA